MATVGVKGLTTYTHGHILRVVTVRRSYSRDRLSSWFHT